MDDIFRNRPKWLVLKFSVHSKVNIFINVHCYCLFSQGSKSLKCRVKKKKENTLYGLLWFLEPIANYFLKI